MQSLIYISFIWNDNIKLKNICHNNSSIFSAIPIRKSKIFVMN